MIDLNHVNPRHDAIDARLREWSRWVRVKPMGWTTAPMFRLYRAPKQWESDLEIRIEINTIDAHEMENAVSALPSQHRTAIRWCYVYSYIPDARIRAELGATQVRLKELIDEGRTMLVNRMR